MSSLPPAVTTAIDALSDLPGIGSRSAERLVLTLLRAHNGLDQKIAHALLALKDQVTECATCHHLCERVEGELSLCGVCQSHNRDDHRVCVVAEPADVLALERTHVYKGRYHVLHGVISPLDRVRIDDLRLGQLLTRIRENPPQELVFALPASTDGESTTLYITEKIKDYYTGTVTRLARGIPSGGDLDYLDTATLSRALSERRDFI